MIRYSVVVLFICACFSNNVKAQVTSGNCNDNGYADFFRCMKQCYEEQYNITSLVEKDFCNNGGAGGDSLKVQYLKETVQCATKKCQSAIPLSVCGEDSATITKLTDDDTAKLMSGNYSAVVSHIRTENREHKSHSQRSHSRHHVHRSKKVQNHRQKHLLKKLAGAYGIKKGQLDELLKKLREDSGTQSGQTDSSGTKSGQTDTSESESKKDELWTKLVEASGNLKERSDASGIKTDKVAELLAKLVKTSGVQTDQNNAAATAILSKSLENSELRIGQLNELLLILEKVSGKQTKQLKNVSGILSALDDADDDYYYYDSGEEIGRESGDQSRSIAFASGPQSESVASVSGPGSKALVFAPGDYPDDCEMSDDATSDSNISGVSPTSFPTDTTSSGTSGTATIGASDSTGTSSDGSTTSSLATDLNNPDFSEVSNSFSENRKEFQSASAVAIASNFGNSAKSSSGGLNSPPDGTTLDEYDDTIYDDYYNTFYGMDNNTDNNYYNSTFANISNFYDKANYSSTGSASAFPEAQVIGQTPNIQQFQNSNGESSSASVGSVQVNSNPNMQSYQTNGQIIGGKFTGGGQNTGSSSTPLQNIGFNQQNPTATNNGFGVITNGQNFGPFANAPTVGQLQNAFSQIQGINQRPPIVQNQGNNIGGGGQIANSFMQNQGFYSNPALQQYQSNNYGSGISTNQQPFYQSANTRTQPFVNAYSPTSASGSASSSARSSGQTQTFFSNAPAQSQAFFGSNVGNGPYPDILQNSGFVPQTNTGGSNLVSESSRGIAGAIQSQNFNGGPTFNNPQINGGGINSASDLAGAFASTGNSDQFQGSPANVPVQRQAYSGSNLGNGPVLTIPQYTGNVGQINGGGISKISTNSQSFGGNVPSNQGPVSSFGNSVSAGIFANTGNPASTGNSASAGSSANTGIC